MTYEKVFVVNGVELRVVYSAKGGSAPQLFGLPEDCDPGEAPEIELLEIYIGEVEVSDVVSEAVKSELCQQIAEESAELPCPEIEEPDWMHDRD